MLLPLWDHDRVLGMRIIARRTLRDFGASLVGRKDQRAVATALDTWYAEVHRASWANSSEVRRLYATASIVSADHIVFNIKGNDFRLVVSVEYEKAIVWIKWIGTHKDYDRINAA
jgi:mRNA interferase HigB